MSQTVVLTGINGQLGQYLALHLLADRSNLRVIGTLRHKTSRHETYIFDQSKVTFELMDLSDPISIETLITKYKPDYLINTAANAFVGESWIVPAQHLQINALGVLHILEAIRRHSPHTRFLNLGTSEEFGDVKYSPQDEKHPQSPRSPYGVSKCAARHLVKVWRESYNLFALQAWCSNFESPLRDDKYVTRKITRGVARIARAMRDGKPFEPIELGNLDAVRSWQHAADVAAGLWLMINQPKETAREYVLSAMDSYTVRHFVELAFERAGIQGDWCGSGQHETYRTYIPDSYIKDIEANSDALVRINPAFYRPAEVAQLQGDSSRARAELGWSPQIPFAQLVTDMVRADLVAVGL